MKEIILSTVAIVIISVIAAYGLQAMDWTAANTYATDSVRL